MAKTDRFERTRYIAITYIYPRLLSGNELWNILSSRVQYYFGLKGSTLMGLYLQYNSDDIPFAIFRLNHTTVDQFLLALCSVREYQKNPIVFFTIKTSGTVKSLVQTKSDKILTKIREFIKNANYGKKFADDEKMA